MSSVRCTPASDCPQKLTIEPPARRRRSQRVGYARFVANSLVSHGNQMRLSVSRQCRVQGVLSGEGICMLSYNWKTEKSDQDAQSPEEYAKMDAEDESLARWKASLGIAPGAPVGPAEGPKVLIRS